MKKALVALCLGAVALVGGPASATHGGIHPTFKTERQYAQCAATTKVHNNTAAPLTTTAPTQSVQQGAGCGTASPSVLTGTLPDPVWTGTLKGNVKAITVEIHDIYVGAARAGGTLGITPTVKIDGATVIPVAALKLTPVRSSTGLSEMVRFTITGLDTILSLEDGDGTIERSISLQLHPSYVDANPVNAIVWGTVEVPAGITVNPAANEAVTVAAKAA